MKLSLLGFAFAGAAAIMLQTGITAKLSTAGAAETCIVTNVALHVKRCPPGVTFASAGSGGGGVKEPEAVVTPTAGPVPTCIKTNVALHVKRCPAGV